MARSLAVAAVVLNVLLLNGCGGGDEKEALALAGQSCNEAMTLAQDGEGMPDLVERNAAAADKAATAANLDEQWASLATAISDRTAAEERMIQYSKVIGPNPDPAAFLSDTFNEMAEDDADAKADVLAQCRKVKAAGGKVTQSLLDDFIR